MDTLELHDELTVAERIVRRVAEELTQELRRKLGLGEEYSSWDSGYVDFWIAGRLGIVAYIHIGNRESDNRRLPTLAEAVEWARAYIADLPDPNACDPWFDPAHPLNQPEAA